MSASSELQLAIKNEIEGSSITAPFYDGPPKGRVYPSISVGPSDFRPDDADCIPGREETIQLDVYSRDQGRLNPCKAIVDDLYDVLHDASLTVADPYAVGTCRVTLVRVFLDPDEITAHGAVQITALVETV